jgi:threonine dehydrogenase-like Zn-dependent dehydrogenase
MLSLRLNHDVQQDGPGAPVKIVDSPRAQVIHPNDAVLMVTTTAISQWDVATARTGVANTTPGTEFAGIVVEVGEGVSTVNLDDLVVARCVVSTGKDGALVRFGSEALDGGHAEYVRVPHADETLVKTTGASEERSVFAGGSAALGIAAAEAVIKSAGEGPVLVMGCDAAGLSALAWLKHRRGKTNVVFAADSHVAKLAAAKAYGASPVDAEEIASCKPAAVIAASGANPHSFASGIPIISIGPESSEHPLPWPTIEQVRRAEMAIRLRQIDLTPLVSTVLTLDQAAEAYLVAIDAPPGARSVLLKP